MMKLFSPTVRQAYQPVRRVSEDEEEDRPQAAEKINVRRSSTGGHWSPWVSTLLVMLFALAVGTAGFFVGRQAGRSDIDGLLAPAGTKTETWLYNRTFSNPPTPESEIAWKSIFPKGRGFIHHPTIAPNISGISVFHELHCLSGIRNAYYAAISDGDSSTTSMDMHHGDHTRRDDAHLDAINAHNDPSHVRHCFDYLRRALMCAADTNIEPIDWKLGGSTGWGFQRQCRDYDAVVAWAAKWRTHDQTDIS